MAKKKTAGFAAPSDAATPSSATPAQRRRRAAAPQGAPEFNAPTSTADDRGAIPATVAAPVASTIESTTEPLALPEVGTTSAPTYEQVAEAAYHRYLKRGGGDGLDFDDWIEAEKELRSR